VSAYHLALIADALRKPGPNHPAVLLADMLLPPSAVPTKPCGSNARTVYLPSRDETRGNRGVGRQAGAVDDSTVHEGGREDRCTLWLNWGLLGRWRCRHRKLQGPYSPLIRTKIYRTVNLLH
jgi:hypothetical protein